MTILAILPQKKNPFGGFRSGALELLISIKGTQEGAQNTKHTADPKSFVFCEFCKSMHTHGNASGPLKTSVSKFRGPPEWREVRRKVLYKLCKKCILRARAPRGRDV
jgi:hypothetical protein